ncbi:peptidyl-prolyl cis-trans isomerase [Halolactibacillus alkaliphilus]|uniref:Peptidyl-prolyl cis-trans isomerase n=1 Tax=Halolactibacillus alkaliphilus TaxID=442899 RepID=A0A511X001_9BACI|nr:peptidylprolyl isomerase [Halolactibacillus alkaliphilus]GEN56273.1 peptidyl-prolyl cis-trans isomerase [Halolactibacillus alkaliphilus]GGN66259.1 peptidyl-prolyl cis-trans isomerase [Halolactibacillus alkaliphilus]SFO67379.1 peptidyl-prolyl cis-trans isomerase B (cyclophilin B) [Halolactibacillus alkaliphilus]
MKKYIVVIISLITITLLMLTACSNNASSNDSVKDEMTFEEEQTRFYDDFPEVDKAPLVTIELDSGEEIVLELYPDIAPITVANFISLVESGFYDSLGFHRVIENFMIQGGDPLGNGLGGPDYSIPGEFKSNGYDNTLNHERGVISMARSQSPDSAGSQFFIMHADSDHLDGDYAAFGRVIDGIEVIDQIAAVETKKDDVPVIKQVMTRVTVDTQGVDYPEPLKK